VAAGEASKQLAGNLQVIVQLAGDPRQHGAVAALFSHVQGREQPAAQIDQVGQQRLAFGRAQLVQINVEIGPGDQASAQLR
jgi:hypothetical protein